MPTHQSLSAISPRNPVILIHVSGHGVFVNARGLEEAGRDRGPGIPAGEWYPVRDSTGQPTWMLRETAQFPAREALVAPGARRPLEVVEAEMRRQVALAGEEAISKGITSFHDMGESFETDPFSEKAGQAICHCGSMFLHPGTRRRPGGDRLPHFGWWAMGTAT